MAEVIAILSVCENCMFTHANGECGEIHAYDCPMAEAIPEDDRECNCGAREPWSAIPDNWHPAMGVEEHSEYCEFETDGECDCENLGFSHSACDGCGDTHYGDRYAFVAFDS
jgi:hypothetical protein